MSATKASVAKRVLRKPAKAVALAVGPRLGPRALHGVLAAATRVGLGSRASTALVRVAEAKLREPGKGAVAGERMSHTLLDEPLVSGWQRSRLRAAVSEAEREPGIPVAHPGASKHMKALRASAVAGDRDSFYKHLTDKVHAEIPRQKLAGLLGELGSALAHAKDWRAAADVYHHAMTLERKKDQWKERYLRARRDAPDWGFTSRDPRRAWQLDEIPDLATRGAVAPVDRTVFGWIPASAADAEVVFKVNGHVVAETRAVSEVTLPDGRNYLQFARQLKHLWRYAGAGDTLTVEVGDVPLTIINSGDSYTFGRKHSRVEELLTKLQEGYVIDKYGSLKPGIAGDKNWQAGILDLYAKLRQDLDDAMGLSLIPFYGTMLGAVREQNFIGHDNDFDTIYASSHSDPEKVREEFKAVCTLLLSRGYDLHVKATHTLVKVPGTQDKLDIFFAWFDSDGKFDISYGYHGEPVTKTDAFFQYRAEKLGEFEIPVPSNAEDLLVQLYGAGWHTPDPGFEHHSTTRKVDNRYHLTTQDVTELHWNQFYRDQEPHRASRFAEFVADRFENKGAVVEFGCGSGRDAIYFANRGWTAAACDRSPEGIARANDIMSKSGGLPARFGAVDAGSAEEIRGFLEAHADAYAEAAPFVVYMRFFLHAIDEKTQDLLLGTIASTVTRDFHLCAEFRTVEDRNMAKVHGQHYRRYIDHNALAERLTEKWSFEIQHIEAGQGLSPYDGEDPFLSRIVGYRAPSDAPAA